MATRVSGVLDPSPAGNTKVLTEKPACSKLPRTDSRYSAATVLSATTAV